MYCKKVCLIFHGNSVEKYNICLLFLVVLDVYIILNNPGGARLSACPDWPWDQPSLLYNGYWVFPGGKVQPGRAADHSSPSSAMVMEE